MLGKVEGMGSSVDFRRWLVALNAIETSCD